MEKCKIFIDEKTQCGTNINFSQVDIDSIQTSIKIPAGCLFAGCCHCLGENKQAVSKIYQQIWRDKKNQINFEE